MKKITSYIIERDGIELLNVTESDVPDVIELSVGNSTTPLTRAEFEDLCELRFKIDYAAAKAEEGVNNEH